jgi:hypothetical protein
VVCTIGVSFSILSIYDLDVFVYSCVVQRINSSNYQDVAWSNVTLDDSNRGSVTFSTIDIQSGTYDVYYLVEDGFANITRPLTFSVSKGKVMNEKSYQNSTDMHPSCVLLLLC